MYFYQVDRVNLTREVNKYAHYITGRTLDVGAGPHRRYSFPSSEYLRMDLDGVPNIDIVGFAENIPCDDNSFDSVVCTQTLVDIFEPIKVFGEMARVLKKGGYLLLTTPFILDRQDSPHQSFHPTDIALRRLAIESGLEPVILKGCGGYHSAMFQLRERYLIRRYKLKDRWFSRGISFLFKIIGTIAIYFDSRDTHEINKHFTDNWILVARKK